MITSDDIRALITSMREQGRIAPPPTVDYVHTLRRARKTRVAVLDSSPSPPPVPRRDKGKGKARAVSPIRSPSRDLDDVERKLNDFSPGFDDVGVSENEEGSNGDGDEEEEDIIKWTSAALYVGGADTVECPIFVTAIHSNHFAGTFGRLSPF